MLNKCLVKVKRFKNMYALKNQKLKKRDLKVLTLILYSRYINTSILAFVFVHEHEHVSLKLLTFPGSLHFKTVKCGSH